MVAAFVALMGAEVDAICIAGYNERSSERENIRNGYRARRSDTPCDGQGLAVPFPTNRSLFEPSAEGQRSQS
jgi:putative transposase